MRRRTRPKPMRKNAGGYLVGPPHEQGGIPAIVGRSEPVELEGGEYIINAQTVEALGTNFLDKLNSTQTEYHVGGFNQGQLPMPSQFEMGGRVNYQMRKMQNGGTISQFRKKVPIQNKYQQPCPKGTIPYANGCSPITGNQKNRAGGL